MNKKLLPLLPLISATMLMVGCASMPKTTETPFIHNYPTRDRVEYVLNCIAKHGGLIGNKAFINQYACGCKIDKIAEKLTFEEFENALTFSYLQKTPGEKGAAFRDPEQAKNLRARLKAVDSYAESQCFVR